MSRVQVLTEDTARLQVEELLRKEGFKKGRAQVVERRYNKINASLF